MTREEERKNDRKILAQCRAWKRAASKEIEGMSSEELTAHYKKIMEERRTIYEEVTGKNWDDIPYLGIKPPPGYPGADLFDTINS
ncbi:hypothetical protein AGMMS49940_24750 [Spirochaetia bacterium]|nr:hypothetical protein AGMMS49940_24750 [Spirochaetia bacterium]